MTNRLLSLTASIFITLVPLTILAQTSTGTFVEEFKSLSKINDKNTYAIVNTTEQTVTLPRRYAFSNHTKGLQNLTRTSITAVADDGTSVMVGGANGALNLISQGGSAEDLTGLLAGKSKKINAIGYSLGGSFWLVGGEAKERNGGALLVKLVPGGLKTEDLQALAKDMKMETVTDIACMEDGCLLAGTPAKLAFYDGTGLRDLSAAEGFSASDPIRVASNGVAWFIAATARTLGDNKKTTYPVVGYTFDGDSLHRVSFPSTSVGTSAGSVDVAWNGTEWLIVQGKPVFAAWRISTEPATEITKTIASFVEKKSLDPIIGSSGKQWLIAAKQWKGLLTLSGDAAEDVSLQIPDINGAIFSAITPGPWGNTLIAGNVGGATLLAGVGIEGYVGSSAIESTKTASVSGKNITKVILSAESETPAGTGITYLVGTGENRWESIEVGKEKIMVNQGNALYWRAVLYSENPNLTPRLSKLSLAYNAETPDSITLVRSRDSKRVSDIGKVNSALVKFKNSRGIYPVVDGATENTRWQQLATLLKNGDFLSTLPDDPQHAENTDRQYDYISRGDGSQYVLRTVMEENAGGNKSLSKDIDGVPFLFAQAAYSCDDPVYCVGTNTVPATTTATATKSTPSSSAAAPIFTVVKDPSGKVWRIIDGRKLYWPSASLLSTFRASPKLLAPGEIEQYPRVRLIKIAGKPEVYAITSRDQKRLIPSWESFVSYGYQSKDIMKITGKELGALGDNILIKLDGDNRVWKIEAKKRRLVSNPTVFTKLRFRWEDISTVNVAEFQSHTEGTPLK